MKETESRLPFRWEALMLDGGRAIDVDWRGARVVVAEGEERAEGCRTLGVAPSSLSITPNSLVEKLEGEALVEVGSPLALLVANTDPECFNVGEGIPDVRLEIRGILVGVSLASPVIELFNDGGSRPSCRVCELFVPVVPTEGLPAIVGS
jgi:hypothetical protein